MSDLQILFPEADEISVQGRAVKLFPVQLRHFELFGKVAGEALSVIAAGSLDQIHSYAARNSGDLVKVIVATTSLGHWRARRLPAAVAAQVLIQIIRANAGFFVQAHLAAVKALDGLESSTG